MHSARGAGQGVLADLLDGISGPHHLRLPLFRGLHRNQGRRRARRALLHVRGIQRHRGRLLLVRTKENYGKKVVEFFSP